MKKVAKVIMVDPSGKYLLMHRSDHPTFGRDPDLPGGIVEEEESLLDGAVREITEETGVVVAVQDVKELYVGTEYSSHGTLRGLFMVQLNDRPDVVTSWEHTDYEWLSREEFLQKAMRANDSFMHMVARILNA